MSKKVISERVISSKIVSQNDAFAGKLSKFGFKKPQIFSKFSNLGVSLKATCSAPFILLIAFGVIFFSEKFERGSIVVENLQLEQATESSATEGLHKIQGKPTISKTQLAPNMGEVLYYSYKVEEFAEVEEIEQETVTEVVDGQEVEKVIERTVLVDKWKEVSSADGKWATFSLGKFNIDPQEASKKLEYSEKEFWLDEWDDYYAIEEGESITPRIGDQRMIVTYLDSDTEMIVVGEVNKTSDGEISITSGDTFIVTNKSDAKLISDMQSTESTIFWVTKIVSLLLLVAGFKGLIAPILALLDFIPLVGKAANTVATLLAAVLGVIIIVLTSLIIRYWWILLILLALLGGLVAFVISKSKTDEPKDEAN